eukprot:CAMPEP_0185599830 /NCGR_PEP_ID=MMETSP0434-20130131/82973_1 /TAXON_ID=626734 ORGANISM="Favella taraikaensis, Strain Fe Narragansett Bay" /NCGR_SAMPLE_ID=MMETSP0434 /ASSEMBLY_ACC=CAM_ASM_000379 /LENGTH=77 /DNA_ID=CAMNT_0028229375 /DNA_START=975 /DNA_END=1208 /DNA_ORIENTATION=+
MLFDMASESSEVSTLLQELLPKTLDLFDWYERKLRNKSIPCTFSYRGRTSLLNEESNLDDYPRAVIAHENGEIHLDL